MGSSIGAESSIMEGITCLTAPEGRPSKDVCWMTNIHARDFWFSLRNCSFLLISGHYNLSHNQTCTGNRRDRSAFLAGVDKDLKNMERLVRIAGNGSINNGCELFYTYNSPGDCTSESALHHIRRLTAYCKAQNKRPVIYYSGHGERTQGAWCFKKSQLAPIQVIDELKGFDFGDCMIITDCCFAGNWASQGLHKVQVYAAVEYNHTAQDVGEGGQFTLALLEFHRGVNLDRASCEYGGKYLRQKLTINGESSPICNVSFESNS